MLVVRFVCRGGCAVLLVGVPAISLPIKEKLFVISCYVFANSPFVSAISVYVKSKFTRRSTLLNDFFINRGAVYGMASPVFSAVLGNIRQYCSGCPSALPR